MNVLETAFDKFTRFLTFITGDHRYIHEGRAFVYSGSSGSLAASASYSISFRTPPATAGRYVHFRPTAIVSTANTVRTLTLEEATYTGGAEVTPVNLNRISTNIAKTKLYVGVTPTGGLQIQQLVVGGGANPAGATGGSTESSAELILKQDTTYVVTFTNIGPSTATVVYYEMFWYEED